MKLSKSPRIQEALESMGIRDYFDVLEHLPRDYADFTPTRETELDHKARLVVTGKVAGSATFARHGRVTLIRFPFYTNAGHLFKVIAFNRPYLMKTLVQNEVYTLVGSYDRNKMEVDMVNIVKGEMPEDERIKPVYSLPSSLENYMFIRLVAKAFENTEGNILNVVPMTLKEKYRLLARSDALRKLHQPKSLDDVYQGLRVLKYEECLLFSLKTQLIILDSP